MSKSTTTQCNKIAELASEKIGFYNCIRNKKSPNHNFQELWKAIYVCEDAVNRQSKKEENICLNYEDFVKKITVNQLFSA